MPSFPSLKQSVRARGSTAYRVKTPPRFRGCVACLSSGVAGVCACTNCGNKTAATSKRVTQIAAAVFPFVAHKRHALFPVVKTKRTCERIHGVQGENSTTFPRLRRLFVIRRRGRL